MQRHEDVSCVCIALWEVFVKHRISLVLLESSVFLCVGVQDQQISNQQMPKSNALRVQNEECMRHL